MSFAIHWFRNDLRIFDNPALNNIINRYDSILPIYIMDEKEIEKKPIGSASRWWLHHSLFSLAKSLHGNLSLYIGNPEDIFVKLSNEYDISCISWTRQYHANQIKREEDLEKWANSQNILCYSENGNLLWEPNSIKKSDGTPYRVFTPFYRKGCLLSTPPRKPLQAHVDLNKLTFDESCLSLDSLNLLPQISWDKKMEKYWNIGEQGACQRLEEFIIEGLNFYKGGRDIPSKPYTSKLSPHLHFGEISPNQVWYHILEHKTEENEQHVDHFLSELGWREFSYSQLYYNENLFEKNIQSKFNYFPWDNNEVFFKAWKKGQTGIPIIDAGMRQLWETGYIHNRVRMIVGSFLVKNLLIDWRKGEEWFWDTLVDADLGSNSAGWQWVAGCGADAAPYFRIFNPVTQGEKFDKYGEYTKHFVPELRDMPKEYLFNPWDAPREILEGAGVKYGITYPKPIVSLSESRKKALEALAMTKI